MDVHGTTCGEPWDIYHLRHDAIFEALPPEDAKAWSALPARQRLSSYFREQFRNAVYHREREYAREMGDSKLTDVEAPSQEEAERLTAHLGMTGTIAVRVMPRTTAVPPAFPFAEVP